MRTRGLAIAKGILTEHDDTVVLLGSRDRDRGKSARQVLATENPSHGERIRVVWLDVASDTSVTEAVAVVREQLGAGGSLYGVVNNAGIGEGKLADVLNVNELGMHRVCEAFLPLLAP